jgi:hypothetical protein
VRLDVSPTTRRHQATSPRPHVRGVTARVELADEDDPAIVARVVKALAEVLAGRVG